MTAVGRQDKFSCEMQYDNNDGWILRYTSNGWQYPSIIIHDASVASKIICALSEWLASNQSIPLPCPRDCIRRDGDSDDGSLECRECLRGRPDHYRRIKQGTSGEILPQGRVDSPG